MSFAVGDRFGPYEIVAPLGVGGMGEVYAATDTRLGRKVAVKTLSDPTLASDDARRRVLHEARAAAALNHPNIASLYDVLDTEAGACIVMEFVDGETLGTAIRRGPLPPAWVVAVGLQLARALAAAHEAGVIHRDLKPANIAIRRDGVVKVLDFGVARIARVEPSTSVGTTTTGLRFAGTPGYMAPEQLVGTADARSDLYSAGAVLYEALTGCCPFSSADPIALAIEKTREVPPDVRKLNPHVPQALADVISQALARDPRARYQSAIDFGAALESVSRILSDAPTANDVTDTDAAQEQATNSALPTRTSLRSIGTALNTRPRRAAAAVGMLALIAAVVFAPRALRMAFGPRISGTPVVAVLPFDNLSGDPSRDYLGAGMAETMSATLANVSDLAVISRNEIAEARRRSSQPRQLARALAASFLVTGGVQESDRELQVTVNLTDPEGRIVWGSVYTGGRNEVFDLERRMARDVGEHLSRPAERSVRQPTTSIDALAEYWQGRASLERPGTQGLNDAIRHLQSALADDSRFALAQAALGLAYWQMYQSTKEQDWSDRANAAIEAARRLNSDEPDVHAILGRVYLGTGHTSDAIAEANRALTLQPSAEEPHRLLGDIYTDQGRIEDAVAEYKRALALRPDYWGTYRSLGLAQLNGGQFDNALASFRRITQLQPEDPRGYQLLGNVYLTTLDLPNAAANYERAIALGPSAATYSNVGTVYYDQGRFAEAAAAYQKAIEQVPGWAVMHRNLADALRRMGRKAEADAEYAKAVALFGDALRVNATDAEALAGRAVCEARLGRREAARQDAAQAIGIAPRNASIVYKSACVLALTDDGAAALKDLRRALELGYSAALAREDDDLAPLRGRTGFQQLVAVR